MADEDEEWDGPITEATSSLDDRVESLEAGEANPDNGTHASVSIEERIARLERIADYLHDARQEAIGLTSSVDLLAIATGVLTGRLATVEGRMHSEYLQLRAEAKVDNPEVSDG